MTKAKPLGMQELPSQLSNFRTKSWVGNGANQSISKSDLAQAVGMDDIDAVAKQTGMPSDQVLSALHEHLPEVVNRLTPQGRLPTDHEASRWV